MSYSEVKYAITEKEGGISFYIGSSYMPLPWLKITVHLSIRKIGAVGAIIEWITFFSVSFVVVFYCKVQGRSLQDVYLRAAQRY